MDYATLASPYGFREPSTYYRVLLFNSRHRIAYLAWEREHKYCIVESWKRVTWCDESRFRLLNAEVRLRIRRQAHYALDPACLVVIDLIRRSIDRFRLRYSLDVHPSSFTTTSELSMARSRQSTDCGGEYSTRPWRRSTKDCNSLVTTTELNTLTNMPKIEQDSNCMETSLIIH
ncbi:uncharacterized protein TNCV_3281411 [Trichonephila clavipes]|nr:uncharacterized protein TNCV_3281411 [Trichonephila clavipes]